MVYYTQNHIERGTPHPYDKHSQTLKTAVKKYNNYIFFEKSFFLVKISEKIVCMSQFCITFVLFLKQTKYCFII